MTHINANNELFLYNAIDMLIVDALITIKYDQHKRNSAK